MELWKAQREYRQLATRLRRSLPTSDVFRAEEQLLVALGSGERLATELSVIKAAQRSAMARIRRLRLAIGNSALKQQLGRVLEPVVFAETLAAHGFNELAALFSSVDHEVRHFERRIHDLQERITRHEAVLATAFQRLRCLFTLG